MSEVHSSFTPVKCDLAFASVSEHSTGHHGSKSQHVEVLSVFLGNEEHKAVHKSSGHLPSRSSHVELCRITHTHSRAATCLHVALLQ